MQRHSSDLATCYVGINFYRSANGNELHTAGAQVFNERSDGVVARGGTAQVSKSDRQPHLTLPDARQLLLDALTPPLCQLSVDARLLAADRPHLDAA
ncbi:hypothetical protein ACFV0B_09870 [Streptomyces xanthophaeus]|uniref:hypothetical protein n=1 Tax=Streptomyces xanthophaeus TaxID=67385 RepID=UPI0036A7EE22